MNVEEQVIRAQKGDDEAFYSLILAAKDRLYKIAYSYLKDENEALEAIQETTYRAYIKRKGLKNPAFFHTWLIRILINYCIDAQKRKRRELPFVHLPEVATDEGDIEDRLRLELALGKLSPKYQEIIILKYYQDKTISEIATILGRPEGTIKTWLNKALQQLRGITKEGRWDYA